jgi:hypothetical protein
MLINGLGQNVQSLERTFNRCMGESEKFWNSWNFRPGIFEVFEVFKSSPGQKSDTTFLQLLPKFERQFYYSFHWNSSGNPFVDS